MSRSVPRAELYRVTDVLKCGAGQWFHRWHPERVVDQHVGLAVRRQRGLHKVAYVVVVGDVGAHRHRPSPGVDDLLGDVVETLRAARSQHQIGAVSRTSVRQRRAQPRSDATDDDHLALEHPGHPSILVAICR